MTIWQRLTREPPLVLGVITTGVSLAALFGVPLTVDQMAGIGIFLGALMALVRYLVTPASEVVVQQKPGDTAPVAGPASDITTGAAVDVDVTPVPPPDPNKLNDETPEI